MSRSLTAFVIRQRAVGPALDQWRRLRPYRSGILGLGIVLAFGFISVLAWSGLVGQDWWRVTGAQWESPNLEHWFGTNLLGQDILDRALYSTGTAFQIGLTITIASSVLGVTLGALAGWYRASILDDVILWIMGVLDSIPFYLFVAAVAYAMLGSPWAMQFAMIATFWTSTARLIRGEVIQMREQEFVQSAKAIGLAGPTILVRHVIPNTGHLLLVQAALIFVAAIKTEVILSFLGLGVQEGVSWGLMLSESTQDVLAGHFGNFFAASGFLFALLLGFNMFTDAWQDALDVREVVA